jgi:hypothetical protein
MPNYKVDIKKLFKESTSGDQRTEIWAKITNLDDASTMNKRIWWEDDNGVQHDETPNLPTDVREAVDNAWIEKSRKW